MEAVCAFHYYALILNIEGLSEAIKLKLVWFMSRGGKIFRQKKWSQTDQMDWSTSNLYSEYLTWDNIPLQVFNPNIYPHRKLWMS